MIGVYGGSFDPVHEGHLGTASEAGKLTGCEWVMMIPAALSPGKSAPMVSGQQRLEMLQLAVADRPDLRVDSCEVERQGPSYTVDTLTSLRQRGVEKLLLIMGADSFIKLESWHSWQTLFELAHILVAKRPGVACEPADELAQQFSRRRASCVAALHERPCGLILETTLTQYPISSTQIRAQLSSGNWPVGLPRAVGDYIKRFNLYSD